MTVAIMKPTFKTKELATNTLPIMAKVQMDSAQLPALYLAAKAALQDCAKIDEVKDIQDKHSAIAHYAKQAKDKSLLYYAERIQLRAFVRLGELIASLPGASSKEVMEIHGIGYANQKNAAKAVHIPPKVLNNLIDDKTPPLTKKALGEYGEGYIPTPVGNFNSNTYHQIRRLRLKEQEYTPLKQARELVSHIESLYEDVDCFRTFGYGMGIDIHSEEAMYTLEEMAKSLYFCEDDDGLDPDFNYKCLTPLINQLTEFRDNLPKKHGGELQ